MLVGLVYLIMKSLADLVVADLLLKREPRSLVASL